MTSLRPDEQDRIGLVVRVLQEVGDAGLTALELAERTKLTPGVRADLLSIAVGREFVKRVERYYARG